MASEVKTNKVSPAVGTDVILGDASDTFTIPASVTLDVNGTIDITGATATGFPSAGFAGVHVDVSGGSETYTVPSIAAGDPADITKLVVFITGGGGSGSAGTTAVGNGGGGGAAGTVIARVTVVAADTITIAIGAGGVATADSSATAGNVGGNSTFTHASGSGSFDTITAPGGLGGVINGSQIGAPVAPTVGASNEGIAAKGGWGVLYTGAAGFWGGGGVQGVHSADAATAGVAFGSGGGGGTYSSGLYAGAAGAVGSCFIMEFK